MHGNIFISEHLCSNNNILCKVFWHTATDHENTGLVILDFDSGQFTKILHRINRNMPLRIVPLMVDQSEPGRAVRKSRAENRHAFLVSFIHNGVFIVVVCLDIFSHFNNKFSRRVYAGLHGIGDGSRCIVTDPKIILIYVGIVNAIDMQLPERGIIDKRSALVMTESKCFKKVLINNISAC